MAMSKMSETENISLRQSYGNLIKRHLLVKMCALLLILDCHCLLSEVKANFVYYSYPLHIFIWIGLCGFSTKRWWWLWLWWWWSKWKGEEILLMLLLKILLGSIQNKWGGGQSLKLFFLRHMTLKTYFTPFFLVKGYFSMFKSMR